MNNISLHFFLNTIPHQIFFESSFFIFITFRTALHTAAEKGETEIVKLLLARNGIETTAKDEIQNKIFF